MKTREQLEATGNKILNSVRTELYLSMRFMGPALGSLGSVNENSGHGCGIYPVQSDLSAADLY